MDNRVFLLFFVGLCLLTAGGGGYAVTFDQDYRVTAVEAKTSADNAMDYEDLSPERQRTVDRTLENVHYVAEEGSATPPGVVAVDGRAYGFKSTPTTDFGEPGHPLHYPFLGMAILGALMTVEAMRRNHVPHWRPWERVLAGPDDV